MKRAIVIRYGGFGDALQAASILPHLKTEGWHITWDASEQGFEVLKSDPCIDALILTPTGSVPLPQFGEYWNARTNGFNRVINLCESVENQSLMLPAELGFFHDDETRRRLYGATNYVEHIHRLAGVPGPFLPRFCPLKQELDDSGVFLRSKQRENVVSCVNMHGLVQKNVVLALSGSAEYKVWPLWPEFVEAVLDAGASVFLCGGGRLDAEIANKIVESVNAQRPAAADRVFDLTSKPVRENYAIAWLADCVVGPETGLLNAVASTAGRKVVLLSHSNPRNLTEHWKNTAAIEPSVPCHPCHRLHQTTKFCPRGPSGQFAACAESIEPLRVLAACQSNSEVSCAT